MDSHRYVDNFLPDPVRKPTKFPSQKEERKIDNFRKNWFRGPTPLDEETAPTSQEGDLGSFSSSMSELTSTKRLARRLGSSTTSCRPKAKNRFQTSLKRSLDGSLAINVKSSHRCDPKASHEYPTDNSSLKRETKEELKCSKSTKDLAHSLDLLTTLSGPVKKKALLSTSSLAEPSDDEAGDPVRNIDVNAACIGKSCEEDVSDTRQKDTHQSILKTSTSKTQGHEGTNSKTKSTKRKAEELCLLQRSSSSLPRSPTQCQGSIPKDSGKCKQIFSHFIVLDFESTCWKGRNRFNFSPEIIEFPAVLVSIKENKIIDRFQQYVKPTEQKTLSAFCTQLTGITQDTVNQGVQIERGLELFDEWLSKHIAESSLCFPGTKTNSVNRAILVTWSDWDLKTCLLNECRRKRISYSSHLKTWIDLKKTFQDFYQVPKGLSRALRHVGIQFRGRPHSGIDDAVNTARLLLRMVYDGCLLEATTSLQLPLSECNKRHRDKSNIRTLPSASSFS